MPGYGGGKMGTSQQPKRKRNACTQERDAEESRWEQLHAPVIARPD